MKIIHAQGAVPTNESGLMVYGTTYTPTSTPKTIRLQTEIRHVYFCSFLGLYSGKRASIGVFQNQVVQLGWKEEVNSNNEKYFDIDIPLNCELRYVIIGNRDKTNPFSSEITETASPAVGLSNARQLKCLIAPAGTSAVELQNTLGGTVTYSLAATGQYHLVCSDAFGSAANKISGYATFEGQTGSYAGAYHAEIDWIDASTINVNTYLDGTLTAPPVGLYVSLEIYP